MANSYKLIHDALEANKTHQAELVKYAQDLAAEIQELDNLLDNDNVLDSITSISEPCTTVQIRGGSKPVSIVQSNKLLKPDSPFYPEASCQARYNRNTVPHQIKGKELDALTDAVQRERQRVQKLKRPRFSEQEIHNNELNWTAIAERVSAVYSNVRTADECRIKFEASSRNKEPTTHEGTRQHHVWSTEFDKKLMEAVERYGFNNWMIVARYVSENATASQCEGRYTRVLDPFIRRGAWSAEEDARLCIAAEAYGHSWIDIASVVTGRTNDQCRERWSDRKRTAKGI